MHSKPTPKYASRQAFVARQRQRGRISGFRRRMKTLSRDRRIVAARLRGDAYKTIAEAEGHSPSTIHNVCNRAAIYIRWRQWQNRMIAARQDAIRRTNTVLQDVTLSFKSLSMEYEREEYWIEKRRPPDEIRSPAFVAPPPTLAETYRRAAA